MRDPLSTGALLFGRGDFKSTAGSLCEETLWLLGPTAPEKWAALKTVRRTPRSQALTAAGLYALSAGGNTELIVDAGPHGAMQGGHGHADALSVCVRANGTELLIDPGTGEYAGPGGVRRAFRGTAMHNTLRIGDLDQADQTGAFKWAMLPRVQADVWVTSSNFDLFAAHHDGYSRLEGAVVHERWVFTHKRGFWIIRDVARGSGTHELTLHWHLAPQLRPAASRELLFIADDGPGVAIVLPEGHALEPRIAQTAWSPAYGIVRPTLAVEYGASVTLPAEFCAVIVPLQDAREQLGMLAVMQSGSADNVSGYEYRARDAAYRLFFARAPGCWRLGDYASDARFICWNVQAGKQDVVCAFNGSWAEVKGLRFAI
jgi:hypothetical protein